MRDPLGIYIHVPFCTAKCPYCDFYSLPPEQALLDTYRDAVLTLLDELSGTLPRGADTLYFGGGTPSLLGAGRLGQLIGRARTRFGLFGAEITVECNPGGDGVPGGLRSFFEELRAAGANRLSMGLQSANQAELTLLGRRHTAQDAHDAVKAARDAGFESISLDLMLGLPGQTARELSASVDFCAACGVEHLSAYLLKIEPGTPFARANLAARCPDDDAQADLYLHAAGLLEKAGYAQYEISNFAKPGRESRHNLKYWDCRDYLGIGPAAHSLINGLRWYWPRDLRAFLQDAHDVFLEEGDVPARLLGAQSLPLWGGGQGQPPFEEYAMLRLRLAQGLRRAEALTRYPGEAQAFDALERRAAPLRQAGLIRPEPGRIALTPRGFLLSNAVTARLLG